MKRIHFAIGDFRINIEVRLQDPADSRLSPLNHGMRLTRIDEERRQLLNRYQSF